MGQPSEIVLRLAVEADIPAIKALMQASIETLQSDYLTPQQVQASRAAMGLDTQLITDGTYFCVWDADTLVGCGGWSFRATLYGGNHTKGRSARHLDPATERARIRAMYTHPDHTRRGIAKLILSASEQAAFNAGYLTLEMAATLAGEPFYARCGYRVESRWLDENGSVPVPLLTMVKFFT
ncbi:GNAT family N-acetyltransferase [Litorimonas sp. WD9-15]|uniref:GNAT family N-acetyltransferase n=1 Tax=Litorimonas sp. WD9-15 TaxID=3418716 RepID=UPI003D02E4DD